MKYSTRIAAALAALLLATVSHAQLYPLFGPANGVLKGSTTTPQTTAAASSDVISLWSGTCNSSSFLRGDGSCTASFTSPLSTTLGGTGNAGTLTGLLKGNSASPFTLAASSDVITLWTGTCNSGTFLRADGSCQAPGGSAGGANPSATIGLTAVNGVASTFMTSDSAPSLSQNIAPTWTNNHIWNLGTSSSVPVQFNNTSATTTAATTLAFQNNLSDLFEMTLTGGSYSGSWLSGGPSGESANIYTFNTTPMAFGTNGKSRAAITSGGAWTFNAQDAGGQTNFTFNGRNGNNAMLVSTGAGAGTAFGLVTQAGTNSSDYSFQANSQGATPYFQVRGDGAINGFGQTSASLLRMDPDTAQPTLTITGCTTAPTATAVFAKIGSVVVVIIPTLTCTSNTTALTLTGMPSAFQPTHSQQVAIAPNTVQNNGATISNASISVTNSGTITFLIGGSSSGWTASGTKGPNTAITAVWTIL